MIAKIKEKQKAIILRKQGLSYDEILKKIHVSKSSLSLWLHDIELSAGQRKRLADKWVIGQRKGAEAQRRKRINITKEIKKQAISEIGNITKRELWMIGIALYWAEGSKEKEENGVVRSSLVELGNSDPRLIKVFLKWLHVICAIPKTDIHFRIYLHDNSKQRLNEVQSYWAHVTGFPLHNFEKITWKKHKPKTLRKHTNNDYFGLLDVKVRRSINFNRQIAGWIEGIYDKVEQK